MDWVNDVRFNDYYPSPFLVEGLFKSKLTPAIMSHQKPSDHKPSNDKIPDEHHVHRTGGWLPQDHRVHKDWLHKTIAQVDSNPKELHPVLTEFKEMVEADWRLYMLFTAMFDEIPSKKLYALALHASN